MQINGTWEVDSYDAQAQSGEIGLKNYRAVTFPTLFDQGAVWGDSHMWTIPTDESRPDEEREAALAFLKFLDEHNIDWARTGHLPVHRSVLESEEFKALPHRATYGRPPRSCATCPACRTSAASRT
jgi:multiple sugar transport system substrate-binding protein